MLVDVINLDQRLEALGEPTRLKLLGMLHEPRTAGDIHLETRRGISDEQDQRDMTRQGVRYHLSKLREAGLVETGTTSTNGREVTTYKASPRGLFMTLEQLRVFAEIMDRGFPPSKAPSPPDVPAMQGAWGPEPRLVVVRGFGIGQSFPLEGAAPGEDRGWMLGSDPDAEITLPWDPLVDGKAAELVPTGDGFEVLDMRSASNRVTLNDERMRRGGEAHLHRGDVLQLGLSALLYQGP